MRGLPEEKLSLSGVHEAFGRINVVDVLKLMDDHDAEHIKDLEAALAKFHRLIAAT